MTFGELTEATVIPTRRGPVFWRLPLWVPSAE